MTVQQHEFGVLVILVVLSVPLVLRGAAANRASQGLEIGRSLLMALPLAAFLNLLIRRCVPSETLRAMTERELLGPLDLALGGSAFGLCVLGILILRLRLPLPPQSQAEDTDLENANPK